MSRLLRIQNQYQTTYFLHSYSCYHRHTHKPVEIFFHYGHDDRCSKSDGVNENENATNRWCREGDSRKLRRDELLFLSLSMVIRTILFEWQENGNPRILTVFSFTSRYSKLLWISLINGMDSLHWIAKK